MPLFKNGDLGQVILKMSLPRLDDGVGQPKKRIAEFSELLALKAMLQEFWEFSWAS